MLLSHTLSSAVPSPRPGLSFRVRKGTGRLTWAMTTAKPIQRPTGRTGGRQRNQPRFRSWRSGNRTTDANKTLRSFVSRPQETAFLAIQRETTTGRDPTHHKGKGRKNVPRSPVSTGRLHPSRGFHLRPIKHVFNMRATTVQDRTES